jgi:protein-disulfide isomerase
MHDTLFEHQYALNDANLLTYAGLIALDLVRFKRDMTERRCADRVREDFLSGARSGVNGTPTFFINGVRHNGSYDLQVLLAAIEDAADQTVPRRFPPATYRRTHL